ncbi:GrpB family protein [Streptomyces sp. B6B3]|uniref:GrpB family protein n=1 Tax=Streptomyces sp. B6B3 TaxID=3153570 RepID=UPI00325E0E2A
MSNGNPPWAYERAEVHAPDPRWAADAEAERARLLDLLAPWLVDGVEHVGSTAVPGLVAKPILDLMASVHDPEAVVERALRRLVEDGWCHVPPELDGRPWRRFFVKPDPSGQRRKAHLHLLPCDHERWREQIAFRDMLRRDAHLAARYADLKRRLAHEYGDDREAYTEAKAQFIAEALRRGAR